MKASYDEPVGEFYLDDIAKQENLLLVGQC